MIVGEITFSIRELIRMMLSIMTLSKTTLKKMTFSRVIDVL
jgi:hypothetical protein